MSERRCCLDIFLAHGCQNLDQIRKGWADLVLVLSFASAQMMKSGVLGWGYWGVGSLPVVCLAPLAQYVAYLWGFELGSVVFCGGVCLGVVYSAVLGAPCPPVGVGRRVWTRSRMPL